MNYVGRQGGIAQYLMKIEDIVEMSPLPVAKKRGPYKKRESRSVMNNPKKRAWIKAALLGALVVHPVVGAVVFVFSAVLGCKPFMPDGAPVAYGFDGGSNGISSLLIFYLYSLGVAPLVLSVIGAIIGVLVNSSREP